MHVQLIRTNHVVFIKYSSSTLFDGKKTMSWLFLFVNVFVLNTYNMIWISIAKTKTNVIIFLHFKIIEIWSRWIHKKRCSEYILCERVCDTRVLRYYSEPGKHEPIEIHPENVVVTISINERPRVRMDSHIIYKWSRVHFIKFTLSLRARNG